MNRRSASDLRGVMRLAVDATVGVTDVVEKMHHTIQLTHPPVGASRAGRTSGLTGFVYRSIRGTTRLVGRGFDAGLATLISLLPDGTSNATRDAMVSAINGVSGDHLFETDNPLALKMSIRHRGERIDHEQAVALPDVKPKVLLFIHGLCLNDENWTRQGVNHTEALARDLGYTPLYLRYNTGLSISANGRQLSTMLEVLLHNWPHADCELALAGHSMGGLVARSACHQGRLAGHNWLQHLRKLVFIGTPHHGAPLEKVGSWVDSVMNLSPYTAPFTRLARKRSAGISDLRHGSVTGEAKDSVPLPPGVECYAMAATLAKKPGRVHQHLIGDGLVPVESALGRHRDPARNLGIPESHQWLGFETGHIELLKCPEVYEQLRDWF
jgi:pimeloyl-ACP methyl ester carboxylesterase